MAAVKTAQKKRGLFPNTTRHPQKDTCERNSGAPRVRRGSGEMMAPSVPGGDAAKGRDEGAGPATAWPISEETVSAVASRVRRE